jgi:hypothetical protein
MSDPNLERTLGVLSIQPVGGNEAAPCDGTGFPVARVAREGPTCREERPRLVNMG